jgi:hypothetical protein
MGIRFTCPNGHKLHVKEFLAGRKGICPQCGTKILIPNAEAEGQSGTISSHAGSRTGTASPSIIIAVAESQEVSSAPGMSIPGEVQVEPPPVPAESTRLSFDPATIPDSPSSPAARYVAQRERNRRNQVTLAIVLLIGVIVLAIVLILVLQRESSTPAAALNQQTRSEVLITTNYHPATL